MKILKKSGKITKKELYEIMSPKESTNMSEMSGKELHVDKFVLIEEIDDFQLPKKVLYIKTKDEEIVVSTSKSFVREFEKIILIFGAVEVLEVISEITDNGYEVLTCNYQS